MTSPNVPIEKPIVPRHALVGIVAVSLAAVNSTMGSGLITAGLEDLRGAWSLGVDDAAYITTAFNAGQMFMGPVSVLLAARFGHRQILLVAGFIYVIVSLILPLVPHVVAPILILLVLAGLSSGTFYPLCLSFISRNLPVSLVTYGIAAYNLDLLATNHLTQALEGFYMDHASWHWLFWNQSLLSLPMLLCVYYGIPQTPREQLLPQFSCADITYVAGSLTLFYIALDQGERLDWYNNGLINGLFLGGAILMAAAIIRRWRQPHPYLDFGYLRHRNILLMGLVMIFFRTLLVRVGFIIPTFLEVLHQYRQTEIGALFALSVVPFAIALPAVAFMMRKFRVRTILCMGFAIIAVINFIDAHALSTWMRFEFVPTQMFGAFGICLVAMGTICGIVFEGRMSGAYNNRAGAYAQGAFFQSVRLFASVASVSAFRRFLLFRQHFWQTKLASSLQTDWPAAERSADLGVALQPQAAGPLQAHDVGSALIAKDVQQQAFTLAIDDTFMLLAWLSVIGLLTVSMIARIPLPADLPSADTPVEEITRHPKKGKQRAS
ncbi:MAG: MFS transporter [Cyanobacteria bacterium SZAS LIN-3]|nr:MFS transporter [Cyanobacteria bacterium SZAS LIN-3]